MTLEDFSVICATLATQLRATDFDEPAIRAYYLVLQDLEPELVALAAQRLGKGATLNDKGEAWFPKAPEWRALAGKIEGERAELLAARLRQLHKAGIFACLACEDSTWQQVTDHNSARWKPCDCRKLRRLEVLGRRPLPPIPERLTA